MANENGSTATLTIPPECVDLLMLGASHTVKSDVEAFLEHDSHMQSIEYRFAKPEVQAARQGDRENSLSAVFSSCRVLDELGRTVQRTGDGPITIEGRPDELSWAVQEMVRSVVAGRLKEAADGSPLPHEEMGELMAAMSWALAEAPRLEQEAIEAQAERVEAEREQTTA
jgi:hypothetical protein